MLWVAEFWGTMQQKEEQEVVPHEKYQIIFHQTPPDLYNYEIIVV